MFLPGEILLQVATHVENSADLASLSLVSKQLHALVEEELYSSYNFIGNEEEREFSPRLRLFARTLCADPSKCLKVKRLTLAHWRSPTQKELKRRKVRELGWSSAAMTNLRRHIIILERLESQKIALWDGLRRICRGDDSPLIASLLLMLPNLERLSFLPTSTDDYAVQFIEMLLGNPAFRKQGLPKEHFKNCPVSISVKVILQAFKQQPCAREPVHFFTLQVSNALYAVMFAVLHVMSQTLLLGVRQ